MCLKSCPWDNDSDDCYIKGVSDKWLYSMMIAWSINELKKEEDKEKEN